MVLYYILLPLAWLVFHIGFRVHTVGRENLRKVQTKGCIIAPNHVSAIDPVFIVISRFWGRRMLVLPKRSCLRSTPCSPGSSAAAARSACAAPRRSWRSLTGPWRPAGRGRLCSSSRRAPAKRRASFCPPRAACSSLPPRQGWTLCPAASCTTPRTEECTCSAKCG